MNISKVIVAAYEIMDTWWNRKNKANSKPIQSQNKANTNPIYPVVASGEAGTNPTCSELAEPISEAKYASAYED